MRLQLLKPETLASLWRTVERKAGSQRQAAKLLGNISPLHFWRLRHGRGGKAISVKLYASLWEALEPRDRLRLERAVFPPEAQQVMREYGEWLFQRCDGMLRHTPTLESELRREFPDEWVPLDRFSKQDGSLHPRRYELAVERVLEPLFDASDTTNLGMEVPIAHLRKTGRLREYLRAAVAREVALLKPRIPDPERAKEVAARRRKPGPH